MSESQFTDKKVDESWKEQIEKERKLSEAAKAAPAAQPQGGSAGAPPPSVGVVPGQETADAPAPEAPPEPESIPEEAAPDDDPEAVLFEQFIQSLAIQASMFLGASPDPRTGLVSEDLGQAKYLIDIIGMIANKTRGNLGPREQQMMALLLQDLRMAYVQRAQAAAGGPGQPGLSGMPGQPPR